MNTFSRINNGLRGYILLAAIVMSVLGACAIPEGAYAAGHNATAAGNTLERIVLAQWAPLSKAGARLLYKAGARLLRLAPEVADDAAKGAARQATKKVAPPTVVSTVGKGSSTPGENVGVRKPINSKYRGKRYPASKLPEHLRKKYPDGVPFDKNGYPDFSQYAKKTVKIRDLTGDYASDAQKANRGAGYDKTPDGYTWHHRPDGKTMDLVPSDLHGAVRHTGGASRLRNGG